MLCACKSTTKNPIYSFIIDLDNDIIYKNNFHQLLDSNTMDEELAILQSITFFSLREVKSKNFGCIFTLYNNKYPEAVPLTKQITFVNL